MGFFRKIGRQVEEFKQSAKEVADEQADYACRECGARFHAEREECTECGGPVAPLEPAAAGKEPPDETGGDPTDESAPGEAGTEPTPTGDAAEPEAAAERAASDEGATADSDTDAATDDPGDLIDEAEAGDDGDGGDDDES